MLKGKMNLMVPRSEDEEIAETWPADAAEEILFVQPDITSPVRILYHDEEEMPSIIKLMGDYFKNILPDTMRLDHL
jgi:hypothetical protein